MKTTLKKALSVILTVTMLLSVAVVATVSPTATDVETLFVAYPEYESAGLSTTLLNQFVGIKMDGLSGGAYETPNSANVASNIKIGAIDGIEFGASYSTAALSPNAAYSLHLLFFEPTNQKEITAVEFAVGGQTLTHIVDGDSATLFDTATNDWATDTKVLTKYSRKCFVEIEIPLSRLELSRANGEKEFSTALTITVKNEDSVVGTLEGRLVLSNDWSPAVFPTVDLAGVAVLKDYSSATRPDRAGRVTHDTATKTTTINNNLDGKIGWGSYQTNSNGEASIVSKVVNDCTWHYSATVNITSIPAISNNFPSFTYYDYGTANNTNVTTPAVLILLNDLGNGKTYSNGAMLGIYHYNGTLHLAASDFDTIDLGVAPGTEFELDMFWKLDRSWDIYVNDVFVGSLQRYMGLLNPPAGGSTWSCETMICVQGKADGETLQGTIKDLTLTMSNYHEWEELSGGNDQGGNNQGGNDQGGNDQGGNDQGGNDQGGNDQGGNDQGGNDQGGNDQGGNDQGGNNQAGNNQSGNDTDVVTDSQESTTQAPATESTTTQAPAPTQEGGCKSSVSAMLSVLLISACGVALSRKSRRDK